MRSRRLHAWLVIVCLLGVACSEPANDSPAIVERDDWGEAFADAGVEGTFVLREVGSTTTEVWNLERATSARLPASTFKILNSLIILDADVVADVDEVAPWDGVDRGLPVWNQDHSLRSGIEVSAVWLYQRHARAVGAEQMAAGVAAAAYGNTDIGGDIDRFWLDGDLRITAIEQVDFLERLVLGDLPFAEADIEAVLDILVRERTDGSVWRHKTGTALATTPELGWLVGTTEHDGRRFVFAMNLDLEPVEAVADEPDPQVRQQLSRELLVATGALPPA